MHLGVPIVAQWLTTQLASMRTWVLSLASLSGLSIWLCCELWCRPAATALIRHLAWEPLYAMGAALKRQKDQKKKKLIYFSTSQSRWQKLTTRPFIFPVFFFPANSFKYSELNNIYCK